MVIVTGDEGIAFMGTILQQILEFGEGRIIQILTMPAVADVQILSAFDAQTFALRVMQGFNGNFQKCIFTYKGREINMCVIGHEQF